MTVHDRVAIICAELSGKDASLIGPGWALGQAPVANFYDRSGTAPCLGLDSLDLVQLAMYLEEEFDIDIPDEDVDSDTLNHVGGLVAYVQGKLDVRAGSLIPIWPDVVSLAKMDSMKWTKPQIDQLNRAAINDAIMPELQQLPAQALATSETETAADWLQSVPAQYTTQPGIALELTKDTRPTNSGMLDVRAIADDTSTHAPDALTYGMIAGRASSFTVADMLKRSPELALRHTQEIWGARYELHIAKPERLSDRLRLKLSNLIGELSYWLETELAPSLERLASKIAPGRDAFPKRTGPVFPEGPVKFRRPPVFDEVGE